MFTIYPARMIHTMNRAHPTADAIAVQGSRILGIGTVAELAGWGEHEVDDRFADKVLLPGFIEAHSHVMTGGMWRHPYVGYFDRHAADGHLWTGCTNIGDVIERLIGVEEQMEDPDETLIAWGLDPIYFDPDDRLLAHHLDEVSETRPVFVYHASGHLGTVNSALMAREEITEHTTTPGVPRYTEGPRAGRPNGELQEPAAMSLARTAFGLMRQSMGSADAKWNYGFEARNAGNTTVVDLGTSNITDDDGVAEWRSIVDDPEFPCRVMVAGSSGLGGPIDPADLAAAALRLQPTSSEKLHFGIIKIILDGSIQGFTARISWPHYYNPPEGHPGNGLWLIPPDQMADIVSGFHQAGLTVHCHCNGDEAAEVFIDAVEEAHRRHPRVDTRHTVQHCQLTTPAQYKRMAAMGMCANIFSNHMFYWGDQHREFTVGPERAEQMDACATAESLGVSFSIHSDAPVTPLGPLHVAWCAVNRLTATGRVLGESERISVDTAMRAVTIDAAYQLKLDHEIGSLEAGKFADFVVLESDPYEVDPVALKDIGVWGTVVGGVVYQSDRG
jgi:predicted amidohydrolase YtcJ